MTPLKIGNIDLSFHAASAAVIHRIAQNHGIEIVTSAAPHEEAFRQLAHGEIDILVSAWLPASHSKYLDPIEHRTTKLTTLYEPYCIWAVPDYIPETQISTITDLLKPEIIQTIDQKIQGINPGAGISRFSQNIIEKYHLAEAGYTFHTGTESDCFDRVIQGYKSQETFVVPLWHPQYLHHTYNLRPLREPLGLLGGKDQATLIATNEILTTLPPAFITELKNLHIGNKNISTLDHQITIQKTPPTQAAQNWLNNQKKPNNSPKS